MTTKKHIDELSYIVIGCAIEVHKELGPGLMESIYQRCFEYELALKELSYSSQVQVPICYKENYLDANLRLDILVEDLIIVEIKAIENVLPVHQAQLLTYMRLLEKPKGILLNFNCQNIFKEGQKTMVNNYYTLLP